MDSELKTMQGIMQLISQVNFNVDEEPSNTAEPLARFLNAPKSLTQSTMEEENELL